MCAQPVYVKLDIKNRAVVPTGRVVSKDHYSIKLILPMFIYISILYRSAETVHQLYIEMGVQTISFN